ACSGSFQIFFLKPDEERSVEVVETQKILINELTEHLQHGESVFLTCKPEKPTRDFVAMVQDLNKPLYIIHI
ncbi:hypothetical protein KAI12_05385, partial [Candidatus Bathyarchaeota archaeon]|nr:hypothetical protein [Candidatus Bathyarchaeota archaeon]